MPIQRKRRVIILGMAVWAVGGIAGVPAVAQPDQPYPPIKWVARERLHQHAEAHDEGVDIAYWNERAGPACEVHVAHWVYVTGWVTEMSGGVPIGTRFATYKYDATHPGPQAPIPDKFAYFPPLQASFTTGDTYKAVAMAVDSHDGSVYVVGQGPRVPGATDQDYHLVKYDLELNVEWSRTYNGPVSGNDIPADVAIGLSGCSAPAAYVIITGTSPGAGTGQDITTVAYTTDGELAVQEWPTGLGQTEPGVRRYNHEAVSGDDRAVELGRVIVAVHQTPPFAPILSVVVLGTSWGGETFDDMVTLAWSGPDPTWPTNWVRRYHLYRNDVAMGLADNGILYAVGHSEVPPPATLMGQGGPNVSQDLDVDITTLSYFPDGVERWSVQHDFLQDVDIPRDIEVSVDGSSLTHIWIGGWTINPATNEAELATLLYTEPPFSGVPVWSRRLSLGADAQYAVRLTPRGGDAMWLTGAWVDSPRDSMLTLKFTDPPAPAGPSWYRTYTVGGFDEGRGILSLRIEEPLTNHSIFITGTSSTAGQGRDFVTLRYRE